MNMRCLFATMCLPCLIFCACAKNASQHDILGIYLEMPQKDFLKLNEKNNLGFAENATPILPTTIRYESTNFPYKGEQFEANVAILDGKVQHFALLNDKLESADAAVALYGSLEEDLKNKFGVPDREVGATGDKLRLANLIESGETTYAYCKWDSAGLQLSILGNKDGEYGISVSVVFMTQESARFIPQH